MVLYDFSEDEESNLPLPLNWIRVIDTSGNIIYRNISNGNISEEHPFILQALDSARKLILPTGWIVKEMVTNTGQKDYYYSNPLYDYVGWDPPQFRSCLAQCLIKNGYYDAANAVVYHPNNQLLEHPEVVPDFPVSPQPNVAPKEEKMRIEQLIEPATAENDETFPLQESFSRRDSETSTTRNVDWMELMQHLGSLEEPRTQANYPHTSQRYDSDYYSPPVHPEDDDSHDEIDHCDKYTERTDNESIYSAVSRRSKRSDKWMALLSQQVRSRKITSTSVMDEVGIPFRDRPPEITISTINRLIAMEIDANERCHELLIELRSQLCRRTNITCNLLAYHNLDSDVGSLDTNTICDHPYKIDQINSIITIAEGLISLLRNHVDLLVMGLASMPANSPELLLISYTILHRVLHPFSSDSSMTTSFLLESLNYQIETTASHFYHDNIFRDNSNCNGQVLLLVTLLTDTLIEDVNYQYRPLQRPVFSYHPITSNDNERSYWPDYSLTTLGILLRSYGIRRDVTCFFRLIWRQVLPALCAIIENSNQSDATPSSSPPRHLLQNVTFGKLIPIATRLLECSFLDESLLIYPATATAIIRCFGEICGYQGIYLYLLEFLILPNLIKLLLGDVDSLDNEEPLRYQSLWNHSEKYYDHRNWWPLNGQSFLESSNHQVVTILDGSGLLIWCVWRLYSCAVLCTEEDLTTYTVRSFFSPLDLSPSYTGLSDSKLRTILHRLRAKIMKGCDSLLQLPLDREGTAFLSIHSHEEIKALKSHARNISNLLKNRVNSLVTKPQESLNATIISRHETMILFDSIAFICEEQLDEYEGTIEMEKLQTNESYFEIQRIYHHAIDFLDLCDDIDNQQVDLYAEDIMFLWRTPLPRDWSSIDYYGGNPLELPVPDDISIFTQDTFPPPPPDTEPPPLQDLGYCYEQLQRGYSLTMRYISSLNTMLYHLRLNKHAPHVNTPLNSLLQSEEWFYSPEVEISCPLARENQLYNHSTESSSRKLRPSHFGLEISADQILKSRNDFIPLKSQVNEFFDTFRFQSSSKSAGANTSIDVSNKPRETRIVRPSYLNPSPNSLHLFYTDDKRKVSQPKVSYRMKKATTKITLPETSPLLVPTASYAQQKYQKGNLSDIEKKFVTSLRTPIVIKPSTRKLYPLRHENIHHNSAQPFPEHLRSQMRQDRLDVNGRIIRGANMALNDRSTLNVVRRQKERKMPLPVDNDSSNMIFAPTESRLRQLNQEKNKLNEELTIEQEKGWKNLLRSYDEVSEGSSRKLRPFRPAGVPSSDHSQREIPEIQKNTFTEQSTLPLANLLQSRGIDIRNFLFKLDKVTQNDSEDLMNYTIQQPLHQNEETVMKDTELSQSYDKKTTFPSTTLVSEKKNSLDEGPHPQYPHVMHLSSNIVHNLNSSPELPATPASTPQSSVIFPDMQDNDIFDFSFQDPQSYGKILTAAKTQESIGERPLNLQKRIRQRNNTMAPKPSDTTEPQPRIDIIPPNKLPTKNPMRPVTIVAETDTIPQHHSQKQFLPQSSDEIEEGLHSERPRASSSYSYTNAEGKKPLIEKPEKHPSSPEIILPEIPDDIVQPITRVNSSMESETTEPISSESKGNTQQSQEDPHANRQDHREYEDDEEKSSSHKSTIPILKKQLSMTSNEMRNILIRGYEVIKYGLHGYPKLKIVSYDSNTKEILWRTSKKDRFSFFRSTSSLNEKSLKLPEIMEVRRGIQTDVLMKAGLIDPSRCLSMITRQRTLDLYFNSNKERELFIRTLEILFDDEECEVIFR